MAELRINYDKTCACIPAALSEKTGTNPGLIPLINGSIQGSLVTAYSSDFQARYANEQDTIATQVTMYSALLDDVCKRVNSGLDNLGKPVSAENYTPIEQMIRSAYATLALSTVVELSDGDPLFVGYLEEYIANNSTLNDPVQGAVDSFFSSLKIKEYLDSQGITAQLVTTLRSVM